MRIRIDPSELVLEIISIVIAIVLATAVGQAVESYRAGTRTHAALHEICLEVADDDRELVSVRPLHERVRASFLEALRRRNDDRLSASAISNAFAGPAPRGFHPFEGSTTAWELARGTATLANTPYDLQRVLESRYAEADRVRQNDTAFLDHLEAAPTEDRPNFYFIASAVSSILGDVVAAENRLQTGDAVALAALRHDGDC